MSANPLFQGSSVNADRIIYTPSDFAKLSLLHIQEIGSLQATKPHISKREDLSSYLFFMVRTGSGLLSYDGTEYPLSSGDCVFIDCRKSYFHQTFDDLWSLSWVHFDGPIVANIYQKYKERGGLPAFHTNQLKTYSDVFQNLYHIASGSSYVRDMEINTGLSELLSLLMADSWHPDEAQIGSKRTNLIELKNYLDQNYAKKITLDELSERYFINKFYLTRIFKEQFGVSVNNYLLSVRITHAKNELRFTDKSAEEIGLSCGIGDVYYFSRIFKKVEGITIRDFRKQWN